MPFSACGLGYKAETLLLLCGVVSLFDDRIFNFWKAEPSKRGRLDFAQKWLLVGTWLIAGWRVVKRLYV